MQTPFIIHNVLVTEVSQGLDGNFQIAYSTRNPIDEITKKKTGLMLERYIKSEFIGTPPGFDADEALS